MKNTKLRLLILFSLLLTMILISCQTEDDPDPRDPLYPLKVDRRAVGNFETSKFDGVWKITDFLQDTAILDYTREFYIFKKNTVHEFVSSKNWSNYDSDEEFTISGWGANEFMYSDKIIYTYGKYGAWTKSSYDLSSDGKKLSLEGLELEKMDIKPWAKEDLIGVWYWDAGHTNYGYKEGNYIIYTFTEDSLVNHCYVNGLIDNNYEKRIEINLTDESFTGRLNFNGFYDEQPIETCYYHIIDNKVYLSNGYVLTRYENSDEGL